MESNIFKAVVGLGNPGPQFEFNRHNIGFLVADALVDKYNGSWQKNDVMEYATINVEGRNILVVKPQTFMNSSGKVASLLRKKGIREEETLVIHDELEKPFGSISLKEGGSARGHNGLRSLIELFGPNFYRLRCGISRPEKKSDVAHYVLSNFTEGDVHVEEMIQAAVDKLEELLTAAE